MSSIHSIGSRLDSADNDNSNDSNNNNANNGPQLHSTYCVSGMILSTMPLRPVLLLSPFYR